VGLPGYVCATLARARARYARSNNGFSSIKVYSIILYSASDIASASSVISIHTSVKTIRSVMLSAGPE